MKYQYRALRVRQSESDKRLVLFSVKAPDIAMWAGVPQKKKFGEGEESAGFQREQNPERVRNLGEFYKDRENIIQNPLLCALRDIPPSAVAFEPDADQAGNDCETGTLTVCLADLESLSLEDILLRVKLYLESRVSDLSTQAISSERLGAIRQRAKDAGVLPNAGVDEILEDEYEGSDEEENDQSGAESVVFEESHIFDFWEEVTGRHAILRELRESGGPFVGEDFLGFDRVAMLSYLKPIVLVDGQHRLAGALKAAAATINSPEIRQQIEERIVSGEPAADVNAALLTEHARSLPVSLLMSSSPEEQVFQFIIVNQKATPIGKSLLGTIVSTSLANDELARVQDRLKNAGIQLEESQAITYLARLPDSPFYNLVERGLAGDARDLLQWGVFGSLIRIFRDLKGGVLFGERNDYADLWRRKFLEESGIVADFGAKGFGDCFEYWSSPAGPWRDVFIKFWSIVRDEFSDTSDSDRPNYWGKPRKSNLFNKVSLTILAADFFQCLAESRSKIESVGDIEQLVDSWLDGVSRKYFDRDWGLAGVKKDSTGIRNRWASTWTEYRKNPTSLPSRPVYKSVKNA